MGDFSKWVVNAFDGLTPNLNGIYNNAKFDTTSDWRLKQQALVTGTGMVAMAALGYHLVALAADVTFFLSFPRSALIVIHKSIFDNCKVGFAPRNLQICSVKRINARNRGIRSPRFSTMLQLMLAGRIRLFFKMTAQ